MGNLWVRAWNEGPEITPKQDTKPTFDPLLGWESGRKPRVLTASAEVCPKIDQKIDIEKIKLGECIFY